MSRTLLKVLANQGVKWPLQGVIKCLFYLENNLVIVHFSP